jgi:regulatory subunit for Cdc7p protein kinase
MLTINPTLLERGSDMAPVSQNLSLRRPGQANVDESANPDQGKHAVRKLDVLVKAQEYGIKIWKVEKYARIMQVMFGPASKAPNQSSRLATGSKNSRDTDLTDLLRNERLNGPSDRDRNVATRNLVPFKGTYIFIKDASEQHKPVLMKEFAKVARKEDGTWPQLHATENGRCPFIADDEEEMRQRRIARAKAANADARAQLAHKRNQTQNQTSKTAHPLRESATAVNRQGPTSAILDSKAIFQKELPKCDSISATETRPAHLPKNTHAFNTHEPVASGIQRSNITSAIRSQMISSTADNPGAKAGTSKEVFGLQRKVLEKGRLPDVYGATISGRDRPQVEANIARAGMKRKLEEVMVDEDCESKSRDDVAEQRRRMQKGLAANARLLAARREPKAGYCENCKVKFDDFDHVSLFPLRFVSATNKI